MRKDVLSRYEIEGIEALKAYEPSPKFEPSACLHCKPRDASTTCGQSIQIFPGHDELPRNLVRDKHDRNIGLEKCASGLRVFGNVEICKHGTMTKKRVA